MDERCTERNKDGSPCNARPWRDQKCRWHHPDAQEAIAAGRRRGGTNKSNKARAKRQVADEAITSAELQGYIAITLRGTLAGRIAPGVANAVASLARAAVAVREATELEERLTALEQQVSTTSDRRWRA